MIDQPSRLNWGCGAAPVSGWLNSDLVNAPGVDLCCDIRCGLPITDSSLDYIVSNHALQEIPFLEVAGVLQELRRVLRNGGVLRLALPDMDRAIDAYLRGDGSYFYVPDTDAATVSGKLAVQLTWYGTNRMLFAFESIEELLHKSGFARVVRCAFRETSSTHAAITELDNRERETLFVEAFK